MTSSAQDTGQTRFFSSFEAGDPQPDWSDTVETDASGAKKTGNVTGTPNTGLPGSVRSEIVDVSASADNPPNETKDKAVDGSVSTKWLTRSPTGWLQVRLSKPEAVVHYSLTSANDSPGRDPRDWTLSGSNDGTTWTQLDARSGEDFTDRFQTKEYRFANPTAYTYYRLDITANHGDGLLQLAELDLSNGDTTPPPATDMRSRVAAGPVNGPNMRANAGWTGVKSLQYSGGHVGDGRAYATDKVFAVDIPVHADTELSYVIFPELTRGDLQYPSTHAAVDLAFDDGTYLSDLQGATDQRFSRLSPAGQGAGKALYADQWNHEVARLGDVARGKTIKRILVGYDNPGGNPKTLFNGWIDDIRIADRAPATHEHLSDWVLTTRGTNSSGGFSRGNNIPATAVPHGFNFWTPVTNANTLSWLYDYQRANNSENLPRLQAFAASHEPSPWMGDRQTFQVMPSAAAGTPPTGRSARALTFRHANEVAKPHYYGVTFENGLKTEIAPADHAAIFRFTYPGNDQGLVFDNIDGQPASVTIDRATSTVTGWSDIRSGLSNGATRMYVYATFDKPFADGATTRDRTGWVRFPAAGGPAVTMRIATSFISIDQARHNLELEIGASDGFDDVAARAQRQWDDKLGVITVDGANEDQLTTLYSNLYRLNLYPNSAHENTGTASAPVWEHAVQSATASPASGPAHTGADVKPGKVFVNNGFWDTYRTVWAGYSLLFPQDAGALVDGFVQQYRDGGWVSRWSSPGYANLMTGTSSDVSFADAYVKGVTGFDATDAYDAALKNATVAPPGNPWNPNVGRKGLIESLFLGYTPDNVGEGVSWALEGDINDFGISNMAAGLAAARGTSSADRRRYREEAEYFRSRATNYVHMFDPAIGFFQGRDAQGAWKSAPSAYDPLEWGHQHDYTETDGWNFAFHAPQDGQGLANLYGGREGLARKLDAFFATPETGTHPGSYGGTIHEMIEARDVRMGQWGFSNQVSHHIPWMYAYAGQPAKTQAIVREALRRLYSGSAIGEGYAGDEDNGETSTWYLFAALGFYPLQMGSPYYVVGSPLFKQATVRLPGGRSLVVKAPDNSPENVYVQGLRLNGKDYDKAYLSHADLARGGTLEFDLGPRPSDWGTDRKAAPPSITRGDKPPAPLHDATEPKAGRVDITGADDAGALFDNSSGTEATATGPAPAVEYGFASPREVSFYTLTNGSGDAAGDPRGWVLKGSDDGRSWEVLDVRHDEPFRWRTQTRPFKIDQPGEYRRYRIEFQGAGSGGVRLSEVELLTDRTYPASPLVLQADAGTGRAGGNVPVRATVTNTGTRPVSGTVTATGPAGWTIAPAQASYGPLAPGASTTVTIQAAIPAGTAPGSYAVRVQATAGEDVARATATVRVIGDVIEFTPGTADESTWLFENNGSQLTNVGGRDGRYADGTAWWTYRFDLPDNVTGGSVTLDIGNQYVVWSSTDNQRWTEVMREPNDVRDLSNLSEKPPLDLNALRGTGHTVYLRIGDARPENGWGGWLGHLRLRMTTG